MSKRIKVRTDRFPELKGIDDEVEKALQEKQKGRRFKDAGKRVRGSRKEQAMYKKLIRSSDLDSIEQDEATAIELVKKDKVFPKIDPQAEKENGTDSGCAFLKNEIRKAFPAKPHTNTKEARGEYVRMAEAIFKVLASAISIDQLRELHTLATNGAIIEKMDFSRLFGKRLWNIVFALNGYSYNTGTATRTIVEARKYSGISAKDAAPHFDNLKERCDRQIERHQKCLDTLKQVSSAEDMYEHKKKELTFSGGLLISIMTVKEYVEYVTQVCTKFIGDVKKEFDTKKEEFPFREHKSDWSWSEPKKASKTKGTDKQKIVALPLSYIKRTGGLPIEEVDENIVIEKLCFKSLTLGNYVKDDEAKQHIRHFVAAIVDLCEVLDIDLVINKELAIGFGAFGRGGKAMATYYPTRRLINLTKKNGDGSVAHEWGHFFDHFLNSLALIEASPLRSEKCLHLIMENLGYNKKYFISTRRAPSEQWFKSLLGKAIDRSAHDNPFDESFVSLVVMLRFGYYAPDDLAVGYGRTDDKKRPTDSHLYHHSKLQGTYWASIAEMLARSFECYVFDKLNEKNRVNNYLVSGGSFSHPVYPQGKERSYINKCFDSLVIAMKKEFQLGSFKPFTTKRVDEYIDLTEKGTVNKGVAVNKKQKQKKAMTKTDSKGTVTKRTATTKKTTARTATKTARRKPNEVASMPLEVKIIKRYLNMHGKKITERQVALLYKAIQKAATEKTIRRTSKFAEEIEKIGSDLTATYRTMVGTCTFQIPEKLRPKLEKAVEGYGISPAVALIKRFINLYGNQTKEKAKRLLTSIVNAKKNGKVTLSDKGYSRLVQITAHLEKYLESDTLTVTDVQLDGLKGLARLGK